MKKILFFLAAIIIFFTNNSSCFGEQGASLYLSPKNGTFFVGDTFDISVFVNTEENSINTVEVDLKFPPDLLQVTSPAAGNSFISIWADQPFYSNKDGLVNLKGGIPSPGINTSAGLVSTIKFRAKAPGVATVFFLDSSKILLADGKGTNILKTTSKGEYNLTILPPEGPKVFSSTHPSLNRWYKDNNPIFYWDKETGVTDFSYDLDRDPQGIPDNISEGNSNSAFFNDIADGIWYFHVKAKKGESWGGVSHYLVQIDTTPPKDFIIKIEKTKTAGDSGFFAYFSSDDLFSGIDYYEISLVNVSDSKSENNPFFIEAVSPYRIPFESTGKYSILVNAYDKAGNFKESKSSLSIVYPFLSYGNEGIKISKLLLPWLFFYFLIILLIFLIGLGFYRFVIKKNLAKRLKKEVAEAEKEIEDVKKLENRIHKIRTLEEEARKESERLANKLKNNE